MKMHEFNVLAERISNYVNDTSIIKEDNIDEIAAEISALGDIFEQTALINHFVANHNRRIHIHPLIFNIVLDNYAESFEYLSHKFYRSLWDHQLLEIKQYIICNNFPVNAFIEVMNKTWFIDHHGQDYTLELFYSDLPDECKLGIIL